MQLTKQQVDTIIKNAPIGGDKTTILDGLISRGYELEGVDTNQAKQEIVNRQSKQQQVNSITDKNTLPEKKTLSGKMTSVDIGTQNILPESINQFKEGFKQTQEGGKMMNNGDVSGGIQQVARGALNELGGGIRAVFSPVEAATKIVSQIPGIHEALGGLDNAIQFVGDKIGDSKKLQQFMETNPNAGEIFANSLSTVLAVTGAVKMPEIKAAITDTIDNITARNIKSSVPPTVPPIKPNVVPETSLIQDINTGVSNLKKDIQLKVAKKNVNPQLATSSERLKDPIKTYDTYYEQANKSINDVKVDKPIASVGENMGKAFDSVIKQRSDIGKILGNELKNNGGIKLDITEPKVNLLTELKNSGLSYNPKTKKLTSFQGTKFVPEEINMLQEFVDGVNKLGTTPTLKQIDNFLTQTRTNLKFTKGKTGVLGTTNAERIINGGVAKLKETLNPKVNGNKALSKYWEANKKYSDLSDFIEEGTPLLGKKTASGDYTKDVGVAKSSVTSILNQGKKDFLTKLENLTGYQALDDTVLALQAMSDAGISEGTTLLKAISEGNVPVSKLGWFSKLLNYGLEKGGNALVGSANEQTKAFLQSLSDNPSKTTPIKPKATTKAKGGTTKSKTNQTKK